MEQVSQGENRVSWQALEYFEKQRHSDWYWAVSIIGISLAVTSVILNNVLFAIFVIIALLGIIAHSYIKPKVVNLVVDDGEGVFVGGNIWPYESLSSFFVENYMSGKRIIFGTKNSLNPTFYIILTQEVNERLIKEILKKHIPEKETEESLSEKIMEYLGF